MNDCNEIINHALNESGFRNGVDGEYVPTMLIKPVMLNNGERVEAGSLCYTTVSGCNKSLISEGDDASVHFFMTVDLPSDRFESFFDFCCGNNTVACTAHHNGELCIDATCGAIAPVDEELTGKMTKYKELCVELKRKSLKRDSARAFLNLVSSCELPIIVLFFVPIGLLLSVQNMWITGVIVAILLVLYVCTLETLNFPLWDYEKTAKGKREVAKADELLQWLLNKQSEYIRVSAESKARSEGNL